MKTLRLATFAVAAALATAGTASAAAPAAVIHIHNFAFVPATLTVPAGTTVTVINDDDEPHTATAVDKSFDSEAIDTNGKWTHAFAAPGRFAYFCEMHPMMKGTIVVTAAGAK